MSVRQAKRTVDVERGRFSAGLTLLDLATQPNQAPSNSETNGKPSIVVDLIRPDDLLALNVEAVGCELVVDGEPLLKPLSGEKRAHLVVRFAFQHLAEEASYEGGQMPAAYPDNPTIPTTEFAAADPRPEPPVGARAADGSRLVFAVPPGETILFSTVGILEAMSRLKPLVHELAVPGTAPTGQSRLDGLLSDVRLIALPNGLVGALTGAALYARKPTSKELRQLGAPRGDDSIAAARYSANATRRARRVLFDRTAQFDQATKSPRVAETSLSIRVGGGTQEVRAIFGRGGLIDKHVRPTRVRRKFSRPPSASETAIEAPYRLIISPSDEGRWAHALEPVRASSTVDHVELWHSRLGQLKIDADGAEEIDEQNAGRRIVRAVWARDRDGIPSSAWQQDPNFLTTAPDYPFRMSLSPLDRHMLVRQTAETWPGPKRAIDPVPLAATNVWLSGLGAWLKLRGSWDTRPYSAASYPSILFTNYLAPLGRDQHVEVAYPGYLFPFGHQATLVKVTDRKMRDAAPSIAALYQRKFLVIGEPRRVYPDQRELPFSQVEILPLVTPNLDDPGIFPDLFWPAINGQPFQFKIRALDQEMRQVEFPMQLMWVSERNHDYSIVEGHYVEGTQPGSTTSTPRRVVPTYGQQIAFAPSESGAVATLPTDIIRFLGKAKAGGCDPRMSSADVIIPAVQQLSPGPPIPIAYHPLYKSKGFASSDNKAEMWAQVVTDDVEPEAKWDPKIALPQLLFGAGGASTERSGGFVAPSVPIRGLARVTGVVGSTDNQAAKLNFVPQDFFSGSSPKLFGVIDLTDLVSVESDLLRIPKIISEFASRVEALMDDIGRAASALADAAEEAQRIVNQPGSKPDDWVNAVKDAIDEAKNLKSTFGDFQDRLSKALDKVKAQGKDAATKDFVSGLKDELTETIEDLNKLAAKLPSVIGNILRAVAQLLQTSVEGTIDLVEDIYNYVNGLAENAALARVQFEWKPKVHSWPNTNPPLIQLEPDSLVFSIGAQAGINGKNEVYALAKLVNFKLHLFPDAELIELDFERFAFKSGGGKPEVDVVFRNIHFHGVLKFVETIRELIPLDGFSDPPKLDVTAEGLTAGFGLALPDIAMGMFSITNMSLNADVQVPFLGKAVTVGFSFCTRERPFTISVAFLGGGGWVGIRLSADGLEVLEIGLEAGACIAVDFKVASGSVAAMLGIYIRLESEKASIAGYFRLRGEVDVLGLISAAIELYMALLYHFDSGKLIGEATITVNVSVIGLSKSVHIHAQRTFKGGNADPSFRDVMLEADGSSLAWVAYCQAFAKE